MKYFLVQYDGNYADEFDVYFHMVMSEQELEEAKEAISKTNWDWEEFYFGTNEWIEVSTDDLLGCLQTAKEITEEQFKVLDDLGLLSIGFGDGLNWDSIIEHAEFSSTDEDE